MIKFEHTVFALPFALIGALLASGGLPSGWQLGWILAAMVGARSAAMAFNRIADIHIDRLNPRTQDRALPKGTLTVSFAVAFTVVMSALFVLAAWQLNPLCFYLSFPTLGILFFYSLTKRFTPWSHMVLGLAIGLAPLAAWVAIRGEKRFTPWSHMVLGLAIGLAPLAAWVAIRGEFAWPPVLLSGAVMFWVAGFDVIYALQDMEFDRRAKLFSLPARFGIGRALTISTGFHIMTIALLVATARLMQLGGIAYAGIAVVASILYWEHRIVKPHDLSRVNVAFFNLNGYVSILLLITFATDILIR